MIVTYTSSRRLKSCMAGASLKKAVYEQLARIGKAVASPPRLELLDLLCQSPRTVEALAHEAGLSVANTSQHLQVLHSARLVQARKEGLFVTYSLADQQVCDFYRALRTLAESRLAEIDTIIRQFNNGRESMEPVDKEALLDRVRRAEVIVLDVRPQEEYRAGHIPGAISIPLKELEAQLSMLPRDREIVAYCRGPYCVLAVEAVKLMRSQGLRAVRLEDGVPEWRAGGLPVAVGEAPR
jgi:rhodanese-related sulfurtransferase